MNKDIEPVVFEKHQDLRVKRSYTFEHAKNLQFIPLNADEFSNASTCYPIFFIKDRGTGQFFPIALFGFEKDENLFYSPSQWPVTYIPKMLSLEPFSMSMTEDATGDKKWAFSLDSSSSTLSENEGEALYENSNETPFLTGKREALFEVFNGKKASMSFIDRLLSGGLIKPVKFDMVLASGQTRLVEGLYVIDGEKIKGLSGNSVQEFYDKGYFPAIYAMLSSQYNLFDLVRRKQTKAGSNSDNKLVTLEIVDA